MSLVQSPISSIKYKGNLEIDFKRDDLIHPIISGNKYRKLICQQVPKNTKTIVTFGGAFSNHIVATAFWAKKNNWKSIGLVRTDNLELDNPTLLACQFFGMELQAISRNDYKNHKNEIVNSMLIENADLYIIPEGGSNENAIMGFESCWNEIQQQSNSQYDFVCCAIGTSTSSIGMMKYSPQNVQFYLFPAIKGFDQDEFDQKVKKNISTNVNYSILPPFHNLRFGRINEEVIKFIENFYKKHMILLDPIYTGKMMASIDSMQEKLIGKKILFYHSGGLQGWGGYFYRFPEWKEKYPVLFQAYQKK